MKDKINKELEDLGWASMQSLLDKEMPKEGAFFVENTEGGAVNPVTQNASETLNSRSNRKWLWLLLLLFFVGCGVASLQLLKERASKDAENGTLPIAQKGKNEGENVGEVLTNKPDFKNESIKNYTFGDREKNIKLPSNIAETLIDKSILKQDKNAFENKKNTINDIAQSIVNQLIKTDISPILNNAELEKKGENRLLKQTVNVADNPVFNHIEKTDEDIKNEARTAFNAFLPLDKIALSDSFKAENKVFEIPILTPKKSIKKASKMEWGITVGAHSVLQPSNDSWVNGFQVGGVVSKPIASNWSISLGAAFRSTVANGDSLTYIQADNSTQSGKNSSTASPSFSLTNGTAVRLNRLRYFEMPVLLTYKINKKWGISSGMKTSYLVSKNFAAASNSNVYVVSGMGNAQDRFSSNVLYDNSFNETLGLKRWDFALMGALNYRISSHFNVSARYDFGLNNIFKKPNWVAHNRYLGVNVGYMF